MTNPMYIEQDNQAAARTGLGADLPVDPTFYVSNTEGNAIRAEGGSQPGKPGVSSLGDIGVAGFSEGGTAGVAGVGSDGAPGVLAQGIETRVPPPPVPGPAVLALGFDSEGVRAISPSQNALLASSNTRSIFAYGRDRGIETWSQNGNALYAINSGATMSPALLVKTLAGFWAADFHGNVRVIGDIFTFEGGNYAVVDHPDGSRRLLHSMGAPEPWFEDFGRASLQAGAATVSLESTFAALVPDGDYHVFVTPEGDCNGLYVSNRRSDSFEVHECQGGTSDVSFSYRLAIRRSDIDGERFKSAELPERPDIAAAQETARQAEAHLREAEQGPRLWERPQS